MSAPAPYTHGHHESVLRSHLWRTADNSAAYLVPHLSPGLDLLDVGCGPGTITVDLARRVAPGRVVGVDASGDVIAQAGAGAGGSQGETPTVVFRVADVMELDFPDGAFDVVHAHQVLQHLSDPVGALREMARVCRPGGLVAARDSDYEAMTWYPAVPELDEWLDLYRAVARANGAEPDAGRHLLAWADQAGLVDVESSASAWCYAGGGDARWWGDLWADRVRASAFADHAVRHGLAGPDDLERLAQGWRKWAASPSAWFAVLHGEILARPA